MTKTAYKININQLIALCVENNTKVIIFTPKEIGKACTFVGQNWDLGNNTIEIDTQGNFQLDETPNKIAIITDIN